MLFAAARYGEHGPYGHEEEGRGPVRIAEGLRQARADERVGRMGRVDDGLQGDRPDQYRPEPPDEQDCDGPLHRPHRPREDHEDDEVEKRPVRAVPGIPLHPGPGDGQEGPEREGPEKADCSRVGRPPFRSKARDPADEQKRDSEQEQCTGQPGGDGVASVVSSPVEEDGEGRQARRRDEQHPPAPAGGRQAARSSRSACRGSHASGRRPLPRCSFSRSFGHARSGYNLDSTLWPDLLLLSRRTARTMGEIVAHPFDGRWGEMLGSGRGLRLSGEFGETELGSDGTTCGSESNPPG